ncbi:molecular chaperone TorD family protein [Desulfomonile tiedjei]|uniref:Putative component of anaerobic dehydrogenase n=1 Tax=Desulfomonile tiedjei (strain ATCC 49306 / DSM 6799 / DCB-1) TaxID=706587 RepID=I4C3F5_DESTA|nr:molecular chaperone TorD family protein [Desulfomonile tiedjei]AFM24096.1 putative component of anaerobic dehydrogenase [Desulfomonile tiedjei DSM 6799]
MTPVTVTPEIPGPDALSEAADVLSVLLGTIHPIRSDEAEDALETLRLLLGDSRIPMTLLDPGTFEKVWNEQAFVFLQGQRISLEESVYKFWTSETAHPLSNVKGLSWGDPATHMIELFDGFGLQLSDPRVLSPDHLSVLLGFLSFLMRTRPVDEARVFCADHMDWLNELMETVRDHEAPECLLLAINATQSLVRCAAAGYKEICNGR